MFLDDHEEEVQRLNAEIKKIVADAQKTIGDLRTISDRSTRLSLELCGLVMTGANAMAAIAGVPEKEAAPIADTTEANKETETASV